MDRTEAFNLMREYLESESLRRHSLASEAVMRALALRLGKPETEVERWGLLGLLHDLDYGLTESSPDRHGLTTVELLAERGFTDKELAAIKRHNAEMLGLTRETELDLALTAGEVVTGLIAAAALVQPDKKVASVKPSSAVKKMKDKAFARSVNRDHIKLCEHLGLSLIDFITLAVEAMAALDRETDDAL